MSKLKTLLLFMLASPAFAASFQVCSDGTSTSRFQWLHDTCQQKADSRCHGRAKRGSSWKDTTHSEIGCPTDNDGNIIPGCNIQPYYIESCAQFSC
ncbi:MAG: hypothetical protein ACXWQO_14660 [Bdellovibrionota bacterium]